MINDVSTLWWDQITGPKSLICEVSDTLQNAESIILYVPDDLPWRKEMRYAVEREVRRIDKELYLYYIDCQTDCVINEDGSIDVEDFLIQRFAPSPEIKNGYRKSFGSKTKYIAEKRILHNQIIWVKGMTPSQVKCWVSFCEGWTETNKYDGLFVIECYGGRSYSDSIRRLKQIEYAKHVLYYDSLLFDNMVVANLNMHLEQKQYIAELATQICGTDVELSDKLIGYLSVSNFDAIKALKSLATSEEFRNRFEADNLPKKHPFELLKTEDVVALDELIWKAQLQVLFPLLESERISLINEYISKIRDALNSKYYDEKNNEYKNILQFGEVVDDPFDLELGTLYRMCTLKTDEVGPHKLLIISHKDKERLELIHSMRNRIAHANVCKPQTVAVYLANVPYTWGD